VIDVETKEEKDKTEEEKKAERDKKAAEANDETIVANLIEALSVHENAQ
jgi:hypothetical protein